MNDISIIAQHLRKIRNSVREIQIRFDRHKEDFDPDSSAVIQSAISQALICIDENGSKIRKKTNKLTLQRDGLIKKYRVGNDERV